MSPSQAPQFALESEDKCQLVQLGASVVLVLARLALIASGVLKLDLSAAHRAEILGIRDSVLGLGCRHLCRMHGLLKQASIPSFCPRHWGL